MVNYACALTQSESGKYFEWIIIGFIFCPGGPLNNNNSALPFCDTYLTFEPIKPSREGGGRLIYYDLERESRNLEGYEILGSPAGEVEQVLICLEASKG